MKRLTVLVLVALMVIGGCCHAAEWPEGRSAAQPYSHLPEVNLSETMGYIMLFPRAVLPVTRFCDVLGMYLPREDIQAGEGLAHLYEKVEGEDKPVEVCTVDFGNPDNYVIRDLSEKEMEDLMWGGGTCVEMYLPRSLEFGPEEHSYFVLMDAGCFTANDGALDSLQITSDEAWIPVISGDYGVSGLYYLDGELPAEEEEEEAEIVEEDEEIPDDVGITDVVVTPEEDEDAGDDTKADKKDAKAEADEDEDAEVDADDEDVVIVDGKPVVTAKTESKADEKADDEDADEAEEAEEVEEVPLDPSMYVVKPDPGDRVHFDLIIGGDAKLAVLYSDNGSVQFDETEFSESGAVEGTVVGDDVQWGVAFYDDNDYIFDTIDVGR